jgi:hypothetical protein
MCIDQGTLTHGEALRGAFNSEAELVIQRYRVVIVGKHREFNARNL